MRIIYTRTDGQIGRQKHTHTHTHTHTHAHIYTYSQSGIGIRTGHTFPGDGPPTTSIAPTVSDSSKRASSSSFLPSVSCVHKHDVSTFTGVRLTERSGMNVHKHTTEQQQTPRLICLPSNQHSPNAHQTQQVLPYTQTSCIVHSATTPCCASTQPSSCSRLPSKRSCCRCDGASIAKAWAWRSATVSNHGRTVRLVEPPPSTPEMYTRTLCGEQGRWVHLRRECLRVRVRAFVWL